MWPFTQDPDSADSFTTFSSRGIWPFAQAYPTRTLESVADKSFDYIIVGGGTAGCVLAARLSEDPSVNVLLLERGPVIDSFLSKVPLISVDFRASSAPTYKWLATPLSAAVDPRPLQLVTGKSLGGTSKINAHLYTRGVPGEYNAWAQAGRKGWGWEDVEPFFKKSEKSLLPSPPPYRGTEGVWKTRVVDEFFFKHTAATIEAVKKLGVPYSPESNNPNSPPVLCSRVDLTMDENGRRFSTFDAFIPRKVASSRSNLYVCTEVLTSKIDIQQAEGSLKAVGVFFQRDPVRSGGKPTPTYYAVAKREIVLCSGALADPQLLLLSGIGPGEHLKEHGIPVVKDMPGVGTGLQDHLGVPITFDTPPNDTLYKLERSKMLGLVELLKYIFLGKGLFLFPNPQMFIFVCSKYLNDNSETVLPDASAADAHNPDNIPDIEIMHTAYAAWENHELPPDRGASSFICTLLRPHSKGTVRLASVDPAARPTCDIGFLTDARDWPVMRKALRLGLAISRKVREGGYPLNPSVEPAGESDEELDAFILKHTRTIFHYTSTCRMAPESDGGVVDDELRVHGIRGLRVADASIFPSVPGAHTQAPTVMVAERCAAFMLAARS